MIPASDSQPSRAARRRALTLAVVMWAFGLATTTLLVGLWGRSVASDEATLGESARAVLGSGTVTDRITTWLNDAVGDVAGIGGPEVEAAVSRVADSPAAQATVDHLVSAFVAAALAPSGTEVSVDLGATAQSLVPVLSAELESAGVLLPTNRIEAAVDRIETIVLETEETIGIAGSVYRARGVLTTVLAVGVAALVLFGGLAVALSDDRRRMLRTLATRLAVSAITFVIFLRLGAWAVDPGGGRAPLADGGAVLLGSNHLVLVVVAGAASTVALLAGLSVRRKRLARSPADGPGDMGLRDQTDELELLPV